VKSETARGWSGLLAGRRYVEASGRETIHVEVSISSSKRDPPTENKRRRLRLSHVRDRVARRVSGGRCALFLEYFASDERKRERERCDETTELPPPSAAAAAAAESREHSRRTTSGISRCAPVRASRPPVDVARVALLKGMIITRVPPSSRILFRETTA